MARRVLKRDKVVLLSQLPLFEACSQRELEQVAAISVETRRPAGTVLTREGQVGGVMFVIIDGTAEATNRGRFLGTLGPGDPIGELSLIDGKTRSATVRALSDVHLLEIASDDFQALVASSPKFVKALLRSLSLALRAMNERWPAEL